jgi:hypothetical protein
MGVHGLIRIRSHYPALGFVALFLISIVASVLISQISAPAQVSTSNYFVNPSSCPSGGWKWSFDVVLANNEHVTSSNTVGCAPGEGDTGTPNSEVTHDPAVPGAGTVLTIFLTPSPTGVMISPTQQIVMSLPAGMERNSSQFPTCSLSSLEAQGPKGCPSQSRIGTGTASFKAEPIVTSPINGKVTAFNGEDGKILLWVFPDLGPTFTIVGTPSSGPDGPVLTFEVPDIRTLPGAPNASLTNINLILGQKSTPGGGVCGYGYSCCGYGYPCPLPATLTLVPKAATNPVNTQHCVVATVKDVADDPVSNTSVRFTVTGAVNTSGVESTNSDGQAEFCYHGPSTPGSDTIKAVIE